MILLLIFTMIVILVIFEEGKKRTLIIKIGLPIFLGLSLYTMAGEFYKEPLIEEVELLSSKPETTISGSLLNEKSVAAYELLLRKKDQEILTVKLPRDEITIICTNDETPKLKLIGEKYPEWYPAEYAGLTKIHVREDTRKIVKLILPVGSENGFYKKEERT